MKNIFKQYIAYLKDNPQKLWFKRKLYGWGWTPATWQGWVVIGVFVLFIIWNAFVLDLIPEPTVFDISWFYVKIILSVVLIILICYKKGQKPKWQWGSPKQ